MNYTSLFRVFVLSCMWAPSFVLVKVALQDFPPSSLAFLRIGVAALFLVLLLGLQGFNFPKFGAIWGHITVMAIFALVIPFVLMNMGIENIDAGLAGIINGSVPVFTAIIAHFLVVDERLTTNRVIGILSGTIGFFILLIPALAHGKSGLLDAYGIFLCAFAACSYAGAIIYGRMFIHTASDIAIPTLQLTIATLIVLPVALIIDQPWTLPMPSQTSIIALLILSIWGTALAIIYYFRILVYDGAVVLSMVVLMLPIFTIIFGWIFLGEQLAWYTYIALALVLFGMMLINGMIKLNTMTNRLFKT